MVPVETAVNLLGSSGKLMAPKKMVPEVKIAPRGNPISQQNSP